MDVGQLAVRWRSKVGLIDGFLYVLGQLSSAYTMNWSKWAGTGTTEPWDGSSEQNGFRKGTTALKYAGGRQSTSVYLLSSAYSHLLLALHGRSSTTNTCLNNITWVPSTLCLLAFHPTFVYWVLPTNSFSQECSVGRILTFAFLSLAAVEITDFHLDLHC